jgi:phosphatidylglycerophosphatase C
MPSSDPEMSKRQIWVFDFDKTLSRKDTTLPMILYGTSGFERFKRKMYFILLALAQKAGLISIRKVKEALLKDYFHGYTKERWIEHCNGFVEGIAFSALYHRIDWSDPNIDFYVVSASPVDYLRPCFPERVKVLGSEVKFDEEGVSGLQSHLSGDAKKQAMLVLGLSRFERFYSDHHSDSPLAEMAEEIYLVHGDEVILCKDVKSFVGLSTQNRFSRLFQDDFLAKTGRR